MECSVACILVCYEWICRSNRNRAHGDPLSQKFTVQTPPVKLRLRRDSADEVCISSVLHLSSTAVCPPLFSYLFPSLLLSSSPLLSSFTLLPPPPFILLLSHLLSSAPLHPPLPSFPLLPPSPPFPCSSCLISFPRLPPRPLLSLSLPMFLGPCFLW